MKQIPSITIAATLLSAYVSFIRIEHSNGLIIPSKSRYVPLTVNPHVLPISTSLRLFYDEGNNDDKSNEPEPMARYARVKAPLSTLTAAFGLTVGSNPFFPNIASAETTDTTVSLFDKAVQQYFPGSLTSSEVASRLEKELLSREYYPSTVLLGSSLCSDEINYTPGSLSADLQEKFTNKRRGGSFQVGGLGGLPFIGTSGFGAFTSHCPDKGNIILLFGPHVGVTEDGVIGKVRRIGKEKVSTSCGAAVGAYNAIAAAASTDGMKQTFDLEEVYIIEKLKDKLGVLAENEKSGGDAMIALVTSKMYDICKELVLNEIEPKAADGSFWKNINEITLIGGIVINRDNVNGGEDVFQPLMMKSFNAQGSVDLFNKVFPAPVIVKEEPITPEPIPAPPIVETPPPPPPPPPAPVVEAPAPPPPPPLVVDVPPPPAPVAPITLDPKPQQSVSTPATTPLPPPTAESIDKYLQPNELEKYVPGFLAGSAVAFSLSAILGGISGANDNDDNFYVEPVPPPLDSDPPKPPPQAVQPPQTPPAPPKVVEPAIPPPAPTPTTARSTYLEILNAPSGTSPENDIRAAENARIAAQDKAAEEARRVADSKAVTQVPSSPKQSPPAATTTTTTATVGSSSSYLDALSPQDESIVTPNPVSGSYLDALSTPSADSQTPMISVRAATEDALIATAVEKKIAKENNAASVAGVSSRGTTSSYLDNL